MACRISIVRLAVCCCDRSFTGQIQHKGVVGTMKVFKENIHHSRCSVWRIGSGDRSIARRIDQDHRCIWIIKECRTVTNLEGIQIHNIGVWRQLNLEDAGRFFAFQRQQKCTWIGLSCICLDRFNICNDSDERCIISHKCLHVWDDTFIIHKTL